MKIQNPFRLGLFGGLGVIVAIALGAIVGSLGTVLTWVGAALFLALGLDPLVSWLEKHKFPRGLAIVTVLVGVLAVFAGLVLAIIPVIAEQVDTAITAVPELIEGIQNGEVRDNLLAALPWLPIDDILGNITKTIEETDLASGLGGGLLAVGFGVAQAVTGTIIVLILTLYFVASLTSIKRGLYQLVPASKRPTFIDLAEQVSTSVGRYVIGQGSLALANGILSFLVLTFVLPVIGNLFGVDLDIRYSALLAFIAFLGSLIPLVGTLTASIIITSLVALFNGFPAVLVVGIYYLVYMQVEAYVLNPRIMSSAVKVPGAIVVIAALAGGTLLGILGALIAIPVAAAILLVFRQVIVPRQNELELMPRRSCERRPSITASTCVNRTAAAAVRRATRRQRQLRRVHRAHDLGEHAVGLRLADPEVLAALDGDQLGLGHAPRSARRPRRGAGSRRAPAPPRRGACRCPTMRRARRRVVRCRGGERRIAPSIGVTRSPYLSATSVPNDQPTSHGCGSPSSTTNRIAASRSSRSSTPSPNEPCDVPRGDVTPRKLNRSTARSASAGRRAAALRMMCESMNPPCVGSGCRNTSVATGSASTGSASSPTSVRPSDGVQLDVAAPAGSSVELRIVARHVTGGSSSSACASGDGRRDRPPRPSGRRRATSRCARRPARSRGRTRGRCRSWSRSTAESGCTFQSAVALGLGVLERDERAGEVELLVVGPAPATSRTVRARHGSSLGLTVLRERRYSTGSAPLGLSICSSRVSSRSSIAWARVRMRDG